MKTQLNTLARCLSAASLLVAAAIAASPAHAVVANLAADVVNATMPNGDVVTMWGYSLNGGAVQSPGAQIIVPAGDTTLTINLTNNLPLPTSLIVHGLNQTPAVAGGSLAPVYTDITQPSPNTTATSCAVGSSRFCRIRSLTNEAAATGGTATYTFNNVKPGTYMYQSGTLPQIQVQMGLYGMASKNAVDGNSTVTPAVAGQAYAGLTVDNEVKLVFSEVDPVVHAAVAAGTFTGSTLEYAPKYFRTHSYDATGAVATLLTATAANQSLNMNYNGRQLVRMVNAGLQTRVPTLSDGTWFLVAEDGNPYPYAREQYTAFLPAAKTIDTYFTRAVPAAGADVATVISMFDRRMAIDSSASGAPAGVNGQFVQFTLKGAVTPPAATPPAVSVASCALVGTQGVAYSCTALGNQAALNYSLVSGPAGMAVNPTTGAITWTPNNAQAQRPAAPAVTNPATVRVTVTSGTNAGATADTSFSVTVANVNDAPTTVAKAYKVVAPATAPTNPPYAVVAANGLLVGAADIDGDVITAEVVTQPTGAGNGTVVVNADGSFTYSGYTAPAAAPAATPNSTDRVVTFTYRARDQVSALTPAPALTSANTTVTLTLHRNQRPVANNDAVTTPRNTPIAINVTANDTDVDGTINPTTVTITVPPLFGGSAAVNAATGVITFTPTAVFTGTTFFTYTVRDNDGGTSNTAFATVRVLP